MLRRALLLTLLVCVAQPSAWAQPADQPTQAPRAQPVPLRVRPGTPFPADGTLDAIGAWLRDEYRRLAEARTLVSPGQQCVVISVFVRADALPRRKWIDLAERCRASIDGDASAGRVSALKFASWHLQQAAMNDRTLTDDYPPALVAAIAKALGSEDRATRRAALGAAHGARQLAPDPLAVVPALLRILRDSDPELRRSSAGALSSLSLGRDGAFVGLGAEGPAAVSALVKAIDDPDRLVRMHAYSALGWSGEAGRAAVPTLVARIAGADPGGSRAAIRALQSLGPVAADAVPALIEALASPDERVRCAASLALGAIGPAARDAVPDLITLLDDPVEHVTWYAARALGEIGPDAAPALPRLLAALARDPEAYSGCARVAVERLTGMPR